MAGGTKTTGPGSLTTSASLQARHRHYRCDLVQVTGGEACRARVVFGSAEALVNLAIGGGR